MFNDFDTEIQSDELAAISQIYWEIENVLDWECLGEDGKEDV